MENHRTQIAVIDTYVDTQCEVFQSIPIHFLPPSMGKSVTVGHGTAVCSIIAKTCSNIEISVFPIFHDMQHGIETESVIQCLEFITQNGQHYDIINMSLGMLVLDPDDVKKLEGLCNKISSMGTIIVAAFDNGGAMSYPALFDSVIGVDIAANVKAHTEYVYVMNSPINIRGCALPQRLQWSKGKYLLARGSSFVAPYITGKIATMLQTKALSRQEILENLKQQSQKIIDADSSFFTFPRNIYKKAVCFPFNKEIHSLVRFSEILEIELIDIYDIKHTMHTNRKASEIIGVELKKDFVIKNIDKIDWNMDFDTFILGHIEEIEKILGNQLINKIIDSAKKYKKYIYAFDDSALSYAESIGYQDLFFPHVSNKQIPSQNFGKLWHINAPIVAVLGTRSQQGKFTIQQHFRTILSTLGYEVGYLATEPSGFLFGAHNVLPFGYNSMVNVTTESIVTVANEMLHNIDKMNFDIIVTGGQSGVVPYDYYNMQNILLPQVAFLYGINPDAVILCICADDDMEYIKRSMQFIESAGNTDVVAAVLFPYTYENYMSGMFHKVDLRKGSTTYEQVANYFSEQLKIPVYTHEVDELIRCTQNVIDFLSS